MHRAAIAIRAIGLLFACLAVPLTASAQDATTRRRDPSAPSPPHERMAAFEGTWTIAPGGSFAGQPAPPLKEEETCAWLAGGRRHMVCRKVTEDPDSDEGFESLQVMSYRGRDSTYVAHIAVPGGATLRYEGKLEGDRWVMYLQPSPGMPPGLRVRTIITAAPDEVRFVEEASEDGGPWKVTEDYRHRRIRAGGG